MSPQVSGLWSLVSGLPSPTRPQNITFPNPRLHWARGWDILTSVKLTARQIERLVKRGEVVHTECKDASGGLPDSLWESYSSFANTDGGVILLGVKEVNHKFSIAGVPKAATLIKRFWDGVNNREKVSVNILFDRHVYSVKCRGRDVVVIEVPRADRRERPVYVGRDVFNGAYRRNGEGDYKCSREAVLAMLRDASDVTADATVLESLTVSDLNADSIRHYREEFSRFRPRLAWNKLSDEEFLKKVGAVGRGDDGNLHPNIAGLVCFGDFVTIMHELPNYFLDYRERSSDSARWGDRVCSSDPTWSGNIVDFFYRIYDKVTSGVKTPFALDEHDRRIDETDVHEAVREVVANALIHADYHGRQGIVVEKRFNEIQVSNPGTMRISKEVAIEGGRSDPRNAQVFNIFSLIGIGERSGTGLSNLYALWEQHGFATPLIREEFDPEKTIVNIATESNQSVSDNTRTKPDHNLDTTRTEPDQSAQGDPRIDNKLDNKLGNKLDNKSDLMSSLDNIQTIKDCSGLNSSVRRVFGAIVEDPFMTQQGLSAKLDLSRATIATATATLIKLNFIRRAGSKKTGHWEVIG